MKRTHTRSFATFALAALALVVGVPASAQTQAPGTLPTAPGADKAVTQGPAPTAAMASLAPRNASPLEPWLVTWLLPVAGLLSVGVASYSDKKVRSLRERR